jgi:hypothetical protein
MQLLLLVILAGALGSYVHAIKSFGDYLGNRQLTSSWFVFYVTRPFMGMALALIFYAVLRGGFMAGTPADAKMVNPFGVLAIAGLVGMFADKATQKLSDVFDTIFTTKDDRKDPLGGLSISGPATLTDASLTADYSQALTATGGTPNYTWSQTGLPSGLSLNPTTGEITGRATQATTAPAAITVTVKDSAGASAQKEYKLNVT